MFRGLTAVSIDAKGRITVPSHYRRMFIDESDGELVLTIDTEERCLLLYPASVWQQIEERLESLPSFNAAARRIQRLLIGHATDLELDRQGRVLLPTLLREYAGLDRNVMLVGQSNKVEIWGEAQWSSQRARWLVESLAEKEDMPKELEALSL